MKKLEITREQLIDIAILVGTDYNPDGVKGIGPKKAYRLIKTFKRIENIDKKELDPEMIKFDYKKIREMFLNPEVSLPSVPLDLRDPDPEKIIQFLVKENDFNEERVKGAIQRLQKAMRDLRDMGRQTGLDQWF